MKVSEELQYQSEHLQWLDERLKVGLPVDDSNYQSIGCFDMTLEHVGSMLLLASSALYGSMLALTRVAFESIGRGLWLRHCATPDQRDKFARGKLDLPFADLLKQVESAVGSAGTPLSSLQAGTWKVMNDYTHTGIRQVRSRHSQQAVTGTYLTETVVGALRISGLLALLAAGELASYTGNDTLIIEIQTKARGYGQPWT
ncbi:hypothetical protein DT603_11685 [Pseudoxanthomonas gei]|uniref:Uncharacterized protein n=1 Tax=Pseudoxanthomonas gei TaxID=1383030 RepID=A0ABX0AJW4_9GAMM|nr:hypothetical protein [Pseudoxanthomonas gei]NDK39503.1 hypothetical protein [Pseudoxanthomonas gei]